MNDDLNMNEDIGLDFNNSNIDIFLEATLPFNTGADSDEVFDAHLEAAIDDTIEKLEKILRLEALSDDELAELHTVDAELQEDIDMLDFDGKY